MIKITNSVNQFEYDIRGLVMAFYPGEKICYEAPDSEEKTDELTEEITKILEIVWGDSRVCVRLGEISHEAEFEAEVTVSAKTAVKKITYKVLSEDTGKSLPWGTLTGIRPTKIPMALLEQGTPDEEIVRHMKEDLLVSDAKTSLALDIARREKGLLSKLDYENGYSMYIGIPFCPSTCLYCSFTSYPISMYKGIVDTYLDCLEKELIFTAEHFKDKKLNTIYIGGGTPTTLEAEQIDRLCGIIEKHFDLSNLLEFTIEAGRPDSVTAAKLEAIRRHSVDRISINPQTMKQETLKIIGRHHTVEDIMRVYRLAREYGFDNINMDLIMGLPDESREDVENTMKQIMELAPDNLTVHSLAIKRSSRLNLEHDKYSQFTYENTEEQMELTAEYAARMGLEPYYLYRQKNMAGNLENVGYAKPGKAGLYNILIMEEKQSIVALGAGATSKAVFASNRIERAENVKDIKQYIERIDEMIERKKQLFV